MEVTWNDIKDEIPYLNIIDVRDSYLFKSKRIIGSKNIPYQFLLINPSDYLTKNKEYYIICEYGIKSKMLSSILNKKGYNVKNVIGGIKLYEKMIK